MEEDETMEARAHGGDIEVVMEIMEVYLLLVATVCPKLVLVVVTTIMEITTVTQVQHIMDMGAKTEQRTVEETNKDQGGGEVTTTEEDEEIKEDVEDSNLIKYSTPYSFVIKKTKFLKLETLIEWELKI